MNIQRYQPTRQLNNTQEKLLERLAKVVAEIEAFNTEYQQHSQFSPERHQAYQARNIKTLKQERKQLQHSLQELNTQHQLLTTLSNNIPSLTAYRIQRSLAIYPLWSTSRKPQTTLLRYESSDQKTWLEVHPTATFGQATARDSSILSIVISYAKEIQRKHGTLPHYIPMSRYQLLSALGRPAGGKQYKDLGQALDRLTSTFYKGNIFGDTIFRGTLLSTHSQEDPEGPEQILFELDGTIRSAISGNLIYALPKEILLDDSLLRQEIGKKVWVHLGKQAQWQVTLNRLAKMTNYQSSPQRLRASISSYQKFFQRWFAITWEGTGPDSRCIFTKTKSQASNQPTA